MRLYVPAAAEDLRRLEDEGRLTDVGRLPALAVTPWALQELGVDDAEDEEAEYAVLAAAAQETVGDASPVAVLVFDLPGVDLPSDGLHVTVGPDLPRRRLAAVHPLPDLEWYAGHELPDVVAALG